MAGRPLSFEAMRIVNRGDCPWHARHRRQRAKSIQRRCQPLYPASASGPHGHSRAQPLSVALLDHLDLGVLLASTSLALVQRQRLMRLLRHIEPNAP